MSILKTILSPLF